LALGKTGPYRSVDRPKDFAVVKAPTRSDPLQLLSGVQFQSRHTDPPPDSI
jgi:hypothetical protein